MEGGDTDNLLLGPIPRKPKRAPKAVTQDDSDSDQDKKPRARETLTTQPSLKPEESGVAHGEVEPKEGLPDNKDDPVSALGDTTEEEEGEIIQAEVEKETKTKPGIAPEVEGKLAHAKESERNHPPIDELGNKTVVEPPTTQEEEGEKEIVPDKPQLELTVEEKDSPGSNELQEAPVNESVQEVPGKESAPVSTVKDTTDIPAVAQEETCR